MRSRFKGIRGKLCSRIVFKFGQCAIIGSVEKFKSQLDSLISEGGSSVTEFLKDLQIIVGRMLIFLVVDMASYTPMLPSHGMQRW